MAPATVDRVCTNGKYSAMYRWARSRDTRNAWLSAPNRSWFALPAERLGHPHPGHVLGEVGVDRGHLLP